MAMPSARPTITIARPNISGRSLMAASAAAPVYATAMAAPIDDPATAIAAASRAMPPAPDDGAAAAVGPATAGAAVSTIAVTATAAPSRIRPTTARARSQVDMVPPHWTVRRRPSGRATAGTAGPPPGRPGRT